METVGRDAARALGRIGDGRAVLPLVDALYDSHDEVRQAARAALGKLGAPAVEPLITALGHPQPEVRQAAAEALVSLYRSGKLDEAQKARLLTQRPRQHWRRLPGLNRVKTQGRSVTWVSGAG